MALGTIHRRNIVDRTTMNQSLSQASEHRRQLPVARSQSIKILRNKNSCSHCQYETDESSRKAWEEDMSVLEDQYKSATMQMYYRITEHRMRNSMVYSNATYTESATSKSNHHDGIAFPSRISMHSNANDTVDTSTDNATYISEENGAIFEMDL